MCQLNNNQRNQAIDDLSDNFVTQLLALKTDRKEFTKEQLETLEFMVGAHRIKATESEQQRHLGSILGIIRHNLYN